MDAFSEPAFRFIFRTGGHLRLLPLVPAAAAYACADMNIEDEFIASVLAHSESVESGDVDANLLAAAKIERIKAAIRAERDGGLAAMRRLVAHPNPAVAVWAAQDLLPLDEAAAVAVLERISNMERGEVRFDAQIMLEVWREEQGDNAGYH
jgi:hypothetical protein